MSEAQLAPLSKILDVSPKKVVAKDAITSAQRIVEETLVLIMMHVTTHPQNDRVRYYPLKNDKARTFLQHADEQEDDNAKYDLIDPMAYVFPCLVAGLARQ